MNKSLNKFNDQVNLAVPYLKANNTRLKFSSTGLTALENNLKNWNSIYPKSQSPATRTPNVVGEMHELQNAFSKNIRAMQQSLKHSVDVVLTADDYQNLGINKDKKTKTAVPVPTKAPILTVVSQERATFRIEASITKLPEFDHKSIMNDGVSQIYISVFIRKPGDADVPTENELKFYKSFSTSTFDIVFPAENIGDTAFMLGQLVNTKSEVGPKGEAINFVIPS